MSATIRPLILCGGSGTRLWPVSRDAMPKQFASLLGTRSTFQDTVLRVSGSSLFGRPLIIANQNHRFTIERQLKEIGVAADLLLEPVGRDSGPAIIAGALLIAEDDPETPVLVLAADHLVRDTPAFLETVRDGLPSALQGSIVTHGIMPTHPSTAYGYIEAGDAIDVEARSVKRFVEKPDITTAARYILDGYFWNSGNFLFKASTLMLEYERLEPETVDAVRAAVSNRSSDLGASVLDANHFGRAVKRSIDYAVMNHTTCAAIVKAKFDWSDIGTWDVLWAMGDKDENGNVLNGNAKQIGSASCLVQTDGLLTTLVGVRDLVVITTQDAVLVADKAHSADVKILVEQMKSEHRPEASEHPKVHRPWGWFQTLDLGKRFRVKRIVVYPSGRLSLQRHHHRAEHWVVVTGTAQITVGANKTILSENQSVYISLGEVHRLENPGMIDLELIEVQTGSYLGEDDIVRLEDVYNRVGA